MCPSLDEAALFDHGLDALDKHFLQIYGLLAPQTMRGKYVIVWLVIGLWLVRIKNTCLSGRSHSSKSDLVSSLGLASGRALPMRSEFRLGLPCRREFARVAAQIFSGTLNSVVGDRYA